VVPPSLRNAWGPVGKGGGVPAALSRAYSGTKLVGPCLGALTGRGFESHHLHLRGWLLALGGWIVGGIIVYALPVDAASALVDVGTWPHVLGTDPLGRDILVRLLRGLWWSLSLGLGGMGVGLGLGVGVGLVTGYFGGWVDRVGRVVMQVLWVVPSLLWAAILAYVLGKGVGSVILAVGLASWVETGRLIRVEVRRLRKAAFVEAAVVMGYPAGRILRRHIGPVLGSVIRVQGLSLFATGVLIEGGLGFVGLSVGPPHVSLGGLLYEGVGWLSLPQGQVQVIGSTFLLVGMVFVVYLLSQKMRA
jgi:peptide/nickel transport system permease protein